MGFGLGHPSLAVFRLVKGSDTGLNLKLDDLFSREIEAPSLFEIIKSFFTRRPLQLKIKPYPDYLIRRLLTVQRGVDTKVKGEIDKAKRQGRRGY